MLQLVSPHSHCIISDPDPSSEASENVGDSGYLSPPEKKNHKLLRSSYSVPWTREPLIEEVTGSDEALTENSTCSELTIVTLSGE